MDEIVRIRGTDFIVCDCIKCGTVFIASKAMIEHARRMGGYYHCPAGHGQGWGKGESEFDKLIRQRDRLAQQIAQRDDAIEAERRRADKAEREITRQKKRAKAGVCSCCHRHFVDLERHMKSKHSESEAA